MATHEFDGNPCSIGTRNWRHPLQWPIRSIIQIRLKIRINTDAIFKNCACAMKTPGPNGQQNTQSNQKKKKAETNWIRLVLIIMCERLDMWGTTICVCVRFWVLNMCVFVCVWLNMVASATYMGKHSKEECRVWYFGGNSRMVLAKRLVCFGAVGIMRKEVLVLTIVFRLFFYVYIYNFYSTYYRQR